MINIIFFGPPGAGKGTQAKIISEYLNISHLSTGEVLRNKILDKDNIAIELKKIMSSGKLVSDDILNSIVFSRLTNEKNKGFILDGYPRSLAQAEYLNDCLKKIDYKIDFIFNIQIDFNILKDRILKRSSEESRDDDKLDVIETRYSEYLNTTEKVSQFYKEQNPNIFFDIDGKLKISQITREIMEILKKS